MTIPKHLDIPEFDAQVWKTFPDGYHVGSLAAGGSEVAFREFLGRPMT